MLKKRVSMAPVEQLGREGQYILGSITGEGSDQAGMCRFVMTDENRCKALSYKFSCYSIQGASRTTGLERIFWFLSLASF